jgi:hypothetical protein
MTKLRVAVGKIESWFRELLFTQGAPVKQRLKVDVTNRWIKSAGINLRLPINRCAPLLLWVLESSSNSGFLWRYCILKS